jgi:PTS system galactitol-specific IIA component
MIWEKLDVNLISLGVEAKTKDDVFRKVGGMLVEQGFCKPSYISALIERERDYPTGINTGAFGIAIPHTERQHVNKAAVAIARLKNSVVFYEMGSEDTEVETCLIFMMAVADPEAHLPFLKQLMLVLQNQEVLDRIMCAETKQDVIEAIRRQENKMRDSHSGKASELC